MSLLHRVVEDFKAWRRNEKRVAPGMRGRVYARKEGDASPSAPKQSPHKTELSVSAKVTRADGSTENYIITDGRAVRR